MMTRTQTQAAVMPKSSNHAAPTIVLGGMPKRVASSPQSLTMVPSLIHEVLHSPGQLLDSSTRALMEPRFGHDFSQVRVHTDGRAAESARAVGASAYTVGRDVVFGSQRYNPQTEEGQRLIAHELAHTVQQRVGPSQSPSGEGEPEMQADHAAAAAVSGGRVVITPGSHPMALARQEATRQGIAPTRLTNLQVLQTGAPPSPIRWPGLFGQTAPLTSAEQDALRDTVAHRRSLPVSTNLRTRSFTPAAGVTFTGYQYAGVKASPSTPAVDPIHKLALAEFGLGEGGVSAVVTYDTTLSLGAGFADVASPQWMRDWFDNDKGVEAAFEAAGVSVTRGGMWLAVDDTAQIISGNAARRFIRDNPQLLSLYISLSEDPAHTHSAAQAQQDWVKKWEVDRIDPVLRAEMTTWPPGAVASALHLSHWLPAGGPIAFPARYRGSNGDAVVLAKAFARNLADNRVVPRGSNGAVVVGATVMTSNAVAHYFHAFGIGAKDAGYLERGVSAHPRISMRVADSLTDGSLHNHVLYLEHTYDPRNSGPVNLIDLGT